MKIIKKLINEFHSLAWTIAGAVTVLITLSGETLKMGMWISSAALTVHLVGIILKKEEE